MVAISEKKLVPGNPPYGRKVRLIRDYQVGRNPLGVQVGDEVVISGSGELKSAIHHGPRRPRPTVPTDSVGIVREGAYCGGIFDYQKQCPVQFNIPGVPETLGVPWELLELAE